MSIHRTILGGMVGAMLATGLWAAPDIRPLSRDDAAAQRVTAEREALAAFRVTARPAHMIRYPVAIETDPPSLRPVARMSYLPNTRWDHKSGSDIWTRTAMSAVSGLDSLVPRDIDRWCPAYAEADARDRRAFWVGMMSALSKYESTYNPTAVGGGGRWFGLLQIAPGTARAYGCRATSGEALKNPRLNLSCAARIMNVTVARDLAVAVHDGRWRGVAADWGPMTSRNKIAAMSAWTSRQDYCQPDVVVRPRVRPAWSATVSTMDAVSPVSD